MADKIGVLGSATATGVTTTTAYTVPAAKASKVKIMYLLNAGADSLGEFSILVNGLTVGTATNMTTVYYVHSNSTLLINPETAAVPTGGTALLTVSPAPFEYYLSAADTVQYAVGTTALTSIDFQVVGTEIDV